MSRAASLESSLRYYDHKTGKALAAEAAALRRDAQRRIDRLPADFRANWTRRNVYGQS